jgi:curved DNA-binding protein CbpA
MAKDYYSILGVPQNATTDQVRKRFLELARSRHPDHVQGEAKDRAEADFQEITEAFNVLRDPERRRQVDAELARPEAGQADQGEAAKVYLRRGVKAYREGRHQEAVENFERATKEDASDARAWSYLAQACQHQKRWRARGRQAAAKACQLEPMNATYLKLAGKLFLQADMLARAGKFYVAAQNWGGDDPEVEEALAEIKRRSKKGRGGLFSREG